MRLPTMTHGPITVWTGRAAGSANAKVHPVLIRTTADLAKLRMGLQMGESTGDLTLALGIRYGTDGLSWGTMNTLSGLSLTADGSGFEHDFASLPGTPDIYCQVCFLVYNTANTALEFCNASLRFESRS